MILFVNLDAVGMVPVLDLLCREIGFLKGSISFSAKG
jgi:hypothetical protein